MSKSPEDFNRALATYLQVHEQIQDYLQQVGIDWTTVTPEQIKALYRGLTASNQSTASDWGNNLGKSFGWEEGVGPGILRNAWSMLHQSD